MNRRAIAKKVTGLVKASRIEAERSVRRIDWRSREAAEDAPLFVMPEPIGLPDVVCPHCGAQFPADRIDGHRRRVGLDRESVTVGGEYVPPRLLVA